MHGAHDHAVRQGRKAQIERSQQVRVRGHAGVLKKAISM
jgi:hypothetical protein